METMTLKHEGVAISCIQLISDYDGCDKVLLLTPLWHTQTRARTQYSAYLLADSTLLARDVFASVFATSCGYAK